MIRESCHCVSRLMQLVIRQQCLCSLLSTVPARYCRVETNYLDRRSSFYYYFDQRGTFNNSLLAKWPNLGCFQVVLRGHGTIFISEPRRGTRAVFFNNLVFKLTRQYRAGTVLELWRVYAVTRAVGAWRLHLIAVGCGAVGWRRGRQRRRQGRLPGQACSFPGAARSLSWCNLHIRIAIQDCSPETTCSAGLRPSFGLHSTMISFVGCIAHTHADWLAVCMLWMFR